MRVVPYQQSPMRAQVGFEPTSNRFGGCRFSVKLLSHAILAEPRWIATLYEYSLRGVVPIAILVTGISYGCPLLLESERN